MHRILFALGLALTAWPFSAVLFADEPAAEDRSVVAGKYALTVPEGWKREKPRSRIIEHEFSAPASEGDEYPGRITLMFSGGSLEDNIDRWKGQFTELDGAKSKVDQKRKISGKDVHVVDLWGTYLDKPAPFAEGEEREKFRMLGAIIEMDEGNYFIKFYGPERTVTEQEESFNQLLDSLRKK
jgi:hypothetical protein